MRQNAQQKDDAYLARIMQNSENINAMRRKYATETTEIVHTVHRRTVPAYQLYVFLCADYFG